MRKGTSCLNLLGSATVNMFNFSRPLPYNGVKMVPISWGEEK